MEPSPPTGAVADPALRQALQQAAQLERAGRLQEAAGAYAGILQRFPDLPNTWFNLARLCRRLRRYDAALAAYQQALERGVERPEEARLNRGVIYSDCLNRPDEAERELRAALQHSAGYVPALLNLANLHEDRGRREEAVALYESILAREPGHAAALARLAGASEVTSADAPVIARLEAALAAPGPVAADRATLGFALAQALDRAGAYERAFAACAAANADSRSSMAPPAAPYDRAAQERVVDELIAVFDGATPRATAKAAVRPIFICGMFRSGSTLAEQLLAGHSGARSGGELDFIPALARASLQPFPTAMRTAAPADLARIAGYYDEALARLFPGDARVTDKRPDNFLYLGLIKSLFPSARIVHTVRDPLDTCLSNWFLHLDHAMSHALDLLDIGHYYVQYRRLMDHWRRLYGEDILDFGYEALVQDPEPAARRLLGHCGLGWEDGVLDFHRAPSVVKTASVWQVRRPLYGDSVGRWRNYAAQLEPLREYLTAQGLA